MRILRRIGRDGRGATSLKKSVLAASSGVALALSIIGGIGTAHADSFAGLGVADPSDRNDIVSPLPWRATVQIHNGTLSAQVTSLLPAPSGCSFIAFRASTYPALARLVAEADANPRNDQTHHSSGTAEDIRHFWSHLKRLTAMTNSQRPSRNIHTSFHEYPRG